MVDAQTISIVFAGLSIGLAAIYYMLTLRNSQRAQRLQLETRQAQLLMQLFTRLNERGLHDQISEILVRWEWSDFVEFMEKYGPENNFEGYNTFSMVGTYFNGMGILVQENLVDIHLVTRSFYSVVKPFWEKVAPLVREWRESIGFPGMLSDTEYLYNEMMEDMKKHPELNT